MCIRLTSASSSFGKQNAVPVSLQAGGGIPCRPNPSATLLVLLTSPTRWNRKLGQDWIGHMVQLSWVWSGAVIITTTQLNSILGANCNVTYSSRIMTLNSPGGSTLQCSRWLWDDMPWNSPKRPPYWNSTSGLDFDHFTAVDMSFCTSLRNFIQIGPPSVEKNDIMSIFKMAV